MGSTDFARIYRAKFNLSPSIDRYVPHTKGTTFYTLSGCGAALAIDPVRAMLWRNSAHVAQAANHLKFTDVIFTILLVLYRVFYLPNPI